VSTNEKSSNPFGLSPEEAMNLYLSFKLNRIRGSFSRYIPYGAQLREKELQERRVIRESAKELEHWKQLVKERDGGET
jgi:hypothetical protein